MGKRTGKNRKTDGRAGYGKREMCIRDRSSAALESSADDSLADTAAVFCVFSVFEVSCPAHPVIDNAVQSVKSAIMFLFVFMINTPLNDKN